MLIFFAYLFAIGANSYITWMNEPIQDLKKWLGLNEKFDDFSLSIPDDPMHYTDEDWEKMEKYMEDPVNSQDGYIKRNLIALLNCPYCFGLYSGAAVYAAIVLIGLQTNVYLGHWAVDMIAFGMGNSCFSGMIKSICTK